MNTNQKKFDKEISEIATSIQEEFKIEVDNKKVITEFCRLFENKMMKRLPTVPGLNGKLPMVPGLNGKCNY